jgi:hypothetical protein
MDLKTYKNKLHTGEVQKSYWPVSSIFPFGTYIKVPDEYEIKIPEFFTNSARLEKYIVVRGCKALVGDGLVGDLKVHSTLVQKNPFDDYFICFANELMVKSKKYFWNSGNKTIKIWFTDMKNQIVQVTDFSLDLLLVY